MTISTWVARSSNAACRWAARTFLIVLTAFLFSGEIGSAVLPATASVDPPNSLPSQISRDVLRAQLQQDVVLVDDDDPWVEDRFCPGGPCPSTGFQRLGPPENWQHSSPSDDVWGSTALWLEGLLDGEDSSNAAMWAAILGTSPAEWEVLAHIPVMGTGMADTRAARYCIGGSIMPLLAGRERSEAPSNIVCDYPRTIDQAAAAGHWVSLGTYTFVPDIEIVDGTVTLSDWVGDASLPVSVLFDAVKWVRADPDGAGFHMDAFLRAGGEKGPKVPDGAAFDPGARIAICTEVSRTAYVELEVCQPDGSCSMERQTTSDEWCLTGVVGGVPGRRAVTARAYNPTTRQFWTTDTLSYQMRGTVPTATATQLPPPTATSTRTQAPPTATRDVPTTVPRPTTDPGPCGAAGGDQDGDGLCSDWERMGYQGVDLPGMGADPSRPDIFVEVDYYSRARPKVEFVDKIIEPFARHGIAVHVDVGDAFGSYAHSNVITGDGHITDRDFHAIKQAHFSPERSGLFHYAVAATTLTVKGDSYRGIAENPLQSFSLDGRPGDDFIIAVPGAHLITQAGIFMHELGHNLSLTHGGRPALKSAPNDPLLDHTENKPNLLSVMNDTLTWRGVIRDGQEGHLDYAPFDVAYSLDESTLDESVGLNAGARLQAYGTRWFCPLDPGRVGLKWPPAGITWKVNEAIDWDCFGGANGTAKNDINGDLRLDTLRAHSEWNKLIFTGGDIGGGSAFAGPLGQARVAQAQEPPFEPPLAWGDELSSPFWFTTRLPEFLAVPAGDQRTVPLTVTNAGTNADAYAVTAVVQQGPLELVSPPAALALAPGETRSIDLTIRVALGASAGSEGRVRVRVRSAGSPGIEDTASLEIAVPQPPGGNPAKLYLPLVGGMRPAAVPTSQPTSSSATTLPPAATATPVPPLSLRGALPALPSACVVADGRFAYVGSTSHVAVVDLSTPDAPVVVTTIPSLSCPLAVADDHLFGASGRAVRVVDVARLPTAFTDLGIRHSEGLISVYGLSAIGISGSKIIASEGRNVIRVFERTDPLLAHPTGYTVTGSVMEALSTSSGGFVVANADKGLAYVAADKVVHAQRMPGNPVSLCTATGTVESASDPIYVGSAGSGLLRVEDEVVTRSLDTPGNLRAIACSRDRVYALDQRTDAPSTVLVLDPTLTVLASSTTDGEARDVAVMNDLVLLADGARGFKVLTNVP